MLVSVWNLKYRFKSCVFSRKIREHTWSILMWEKWQLWRGESANIQGPVPSDTVTEIGQIITYFLEDSEESYCSVLSTEYGMKSVYLCTLFELTRISTCKSNLWTFQYIKCTMLRNCWKQSHIHSKLFVARKCQ